jgi:hypothetical protein
MALMARVVGIPARVAIGFLTPEPAGPNTWMYSSHDMHAWPELYFQGSGWVRFEPTPARRAADAPSYTINGTPDDQGPSETAQTRSASATTGPSKQPSQSETTADAAQGDEGDAGINWWPLFRAIGVLVLVIGALLVPSLARRRRRERRLAAGGPEEIWVELRDTAVDLGVPWPDGRSPRETRDALVDHLGCPVDPTTPDRPAHGRDVAPEGVDALGRLVTDLERLRYSRSPADADRARLRADGRVVLASLAGGATRSSRRRATWWPRSVLDLGALRANRAAPTTVEARYGGVVDHAG